MPPGEGVLAYYSASTSMIHRVSNAHAVSDRRDAPANALIYREDFPSTRVGPAETV